MQDEQSVDDLDEPWLELEQDCVGLNQEIATWCPNNTRGQVNTLHTLQTLHILSSLRALDSSHTLYLLHNLNP